MNHCVTVNPSGVMIVSVSGIVETESVLAVIERQWQLGLHKSLWDLSDAQTNYLSTADLRAIADHVGRNRPAEFTPGQTAFLVARDVDHGMMRMVEAYSHGLGLDIRIGRTRSELEQWMNSDLAEDLL